MIVLIATPKLPQPTLRYSAQWISMKLNLYELESLKAEWRSPSIPSRSNFTISKVVGYITGMLTFRLYWTDWPRSPPNKREIHLSKALPGERYSGMDPACTASNQLMQIFIIGKGLLKVMVALGLPK